MKVGIIGSGGREHAICYFKKSKKISEIFCFPGNAGTEIIAKNVLINLDNFDLIKNFIYEKKIDLVIVGPEKPLVEGLVDYLEKYNIKVFGPNKIASQLEGSKIFTKQLCKKFNIPTAKFGVFESKDKSKQFIKKSNFPIVVKADNLASGKGVYIVKIITKLKLPSMKYLMESLLCKKYTIEEFLIGEEMSFLLSTMVKNLKHLEQLKITKGF